MESLPINVKLLSNLAYKNKINIPADNIYNIQDLKIEKPEDVTYFKTLNKTDCLDLTSEIDINNHRKTSLLTYFTLQRHLDSKKASKKIKTVR